MTDSGKEVAGSIPASNEYTLILHTIPPGKTCPSISPFVLKLETYMRMGGIKYTIDTKKPFGAKGKTPWITFNGKEMDDSELIIAFLNKELKKNLWELVSKEEKAVAHFIRILLENHLVLGLAEWRWVNDAGSIDKVMKGSGVKFGVMKMMMRRRIKNRLWSQGFGKFSPEEQMEMMREDFRSFSDYLGKKNYLLGNKPTEVDATGFGFMAQFVYAAPDSPYEKLCEEVEFKNIKAYCERMKEKYWEDWDSLLSK